MGFNSAFKGLTAAATSYVEPIRLL